ncbi:hypothetical protein M0R01_01735 [bacterium]|nr:hypothetical protein [bacterium]
MEPTVLSSYQGQSLAITSSTRLACGVYVLKGRIAPFNKIVSFQVLLNEVGPNPCELRLAYHNSIWILVDETTGDAWIEGASFPFNRMKVRLPLKKGF